MSWFLNRRVCSHSGGKLATEASDKPCSPNRMPHFIFTLTSFLSAEI